MDSAQRKVTQDYSETPFKKFPQYTLGVAGKSRKYLNAKADRVGNEAIFGLSSF